MKNAYMAGTHADCIFHGVLRYHGITVSRCEHDHHDRLSARTCADDAKAAVNARRVLPAGWVPEDG